MRSFLWIQYLAFAAVPVLGFVRPDALGLRPFVATCTSTRSTLHQVQADANNFLFNEFRTYTGEIVDPYKILKVHRTAERSEIRQKYINLSRRYHPDVVRHKDILPGSW